MKMEFRPAEALKHVATELSTLLSAPKRDMDRIQQLLKELPPAPDPDKDYKPITTTPAQKKNTIGVWEKKVVNGQVHYRRDLSREKDWTLWANVQNIYPKTSRRRVILLGESVARGYFYDPHYNVAAELLSILNSTAETKNTEVVDLARTGLPIEELHELVKSCIDMEPDLVVIFAGNNWTQNLPNLLRSNKNIIDDFRKDGLKSVQAMVEENFTKVLDNFMQVVKTSLIDKHVPVVFVIPEFNLKDWRSDELEHGLMLLAENRPLNWLNAKFKAENVRRNNDIAGMENAAMEMIKEDHFNPLGHEILADTYIARKEWKKARVCLEYAKDLALFRGGFPVPRCNGFVKKWLTANAGKYGVTTVDLPAIFQELLSDSIPDRHLFLDYCHFSVEGIKIVSRYIVQAIIEVLTGIKKNINDIKESDLSPSPEVMSVAHFAAAIHNAHYGQSAEIMQYHCRKSLDHSSSVIDLMENFMDFTTRRVSTVLCKKFEEVIIDGRLRVYEGGFSLTQKSSQKLMDVELVDILSEQIDQLQPGTTQKIHDLRISEHGIEDPPVDLLESFYYSAGHTRFTLSKQCNFLKIRSLVSRFFFIVKPGTKALQFELTYRTPVTAEDNCAIKIYINNTDRVFKEIAVSKDWTTTTFLVQSDNTHDGVNSLSIHWPYAASLDKLKRINSSDSFIDTVYSIFAEIYSFSVYQVG